MQESPNETAEEFEADREFDAFLNLSRENRAKFERLREVLTSEGHYGTGATPSKVVLTTFQPVTPASRAMP